MLRRRQQPVEIPREQLLVLFDALSQGICPECAKVHPQKPDSLPYDSNFCSICGTPTPKPLCMCCGGKVIKSQKFCKTCGVQIDPAEAMRVGFEVHPSRGDST